MTWLRWRPRLGTRVLMVQLGGLFLLGLVVLLFLPETKGQDLPE